MVGSSLPLCCRSWEALAWLEELTDAALDGDDDARRCLSDAVDHWLATVRREEARR